MSRGMAGSASALHFVAAPGTVVGLVPWVLTGWQAESLPSYWLPVRVSGAAMACIGIVVIARQFVRFVVEGGGSPAPVVPTERLVVSGLYRHVRNPMYVAVLAAVLGQAMLLGRPVLLGYAAVLGVVMWLFVRWYEEPALARQHGEAYRAYRRAVPGWLPRADGCRRVLQVRRPRAR